MFLVSQIVSNQVIDQIFFNLFLARLYFPKHQNDNLCFRHYLQKVLLTWQFDTYKPVEKTCTQGQQHEGSKNHSKFNMILFLVRSLT